MNKNKNAILTGKQNKYNIQNKYKNKIEKFCGAYVICLFFIYKYTSVVVDLQPIYYPCILNF